MDDIRVSMPMKKYEELISKEGSEKNTSSASMEVINVLIDYNLLLEKALRSELDPKTAFIQAGQALAEVHPKHSLEAARQLTEVRIEQTKPKIDDKG